MGNDPREQAVEQADAVRNQVSHQLQEAPETQAGTDSSDEGVEGEGSYSAAKRYNEAVSHNALDHKRIDAAAQDAAEALDGPEGDTLAEAEEEGRAPARD